MKYSILAIIISLFMNIPVSAHTDNSEGYSRIISDEDGIIYELYLDYFELARVVDLGVQPGVPQQQLTAALQERKNGVLEYLQSHLQVVSTGVKAEAVIVSAETERKQNRDYAKITLRYRLGEVTGTSLRIEYDIFFDDNDPTHRNIVTYDVGGKEGQYIFQSGQREFQLMDAAGLRENIGFVQHGFHHIMIGYDHILFVIALVMGAAKLWDVLKVISFFTLAHSVTLGLSAFHLIQIPPDIVEPLIALSIAFVAIEQLLGFASRYRFAVVFLFGLIHGIGFAGALELTGEFNWNSLLSLLSFNIGVELGQALIILSLFPILQLLRRTRWLIWIHGAATASILCFGLIWYFERLLG